MRPEEREKNAIEELKKRLYTRGDMGRRTLRKGRLIAHGDEVKGNWHEGEESADIYPEEAKIDKPEMSTFKKFFIGSSIFFVLALSYAAYQFFVGGNIVSSKNINITVLGPAFASGGDEISLQVSIENRNSVPLEFADLFIEYPKGASSAKSSSSQEMVRNQISLSQLPAGATHQEIIKATLYGEEGTEQAIKFMLEYRVSGSNAIFQKENVYPVKISSAPINLSLEMPKETNAGQEITFNVKASSNAPKDVPGVLLEVDYPPGFLFKNAEPKPTYGNNVWRLGDFHTGSSRSVRVTGTLSGQDGEERTFRVLSGSMSADDEKSIGVIYNSIFETIAIRRPFLDAVVSLNSDPSQTTAIYPSQEVKGDIVWRNNLPTRVSNAEIRIAFSGNAFNRASVNSEHGYYNSSENTIVWDRNNTEDFQVVEPGATGRLTFTFAPFPLFSAGGGLISQPEIYLQTTVKGEVNTSDGGSGSVSVTTQKSARVSSDLQLLSRAVYFIGPFNNIGPIPPVAEQETTYTVLWSVMNSANDTSDTSVSTILPPYVSWASQTSPQNETVSYDEVSRMVTWRLGNVSAGTGYRSAAREAAFQVKLLPSLSHIGSSVGLTGTVTITGIDSFAGITLQNSKDALTTSLNSDPSFREGNDIVVAPKP